MAAEAASKRAELLEQVDSLRKKYPSESFERNWSIYKSSLDIQDIEAFLVKTVPSMKYIDVTVIGEGLVVDVDGSEDESLGGVMVAPLGMIRSIHFFSEPLEALRLTEDSTLVVTTRLTGATPGGPYWVASTPEEEQDLLLFAGVLRRLIVRTQSKGDARG